MGILKTPKVVPTVTIPTCHTPETCYEKQAEDLIFSAGIPLVPKGPKCKCKAYDMEPRRNIIRIISAVVKTDSGRLVPVVEGLKNLKACLCMEKYKAVIPEDEIIGLHEETCECLRDIDKRYVCCCCRKDDTPEDIYPIVSGTKIIGDGEVIPIIEGLTERKGVEETTCQCLQNRDRKQLICGNFEMDQKIREKGGIAYHDYCCEKGKALPEPKIEVKPKTEQIDYSKLVKIISGIKETCSGDAIPIIEGIAEKPGEHVQIDNQKKRLAVDEEIKPCCLKLSDKIYKIISGMKKTESGHVIPIVDGVQEVKFDASKRVRPPCICERCRNKMTSTKVAKIITGLKVTESGDTIEIVEGLKETEFGSDALYVGKSPCLCKRCLHKRLKKPRFIISSMLETKSGSIIPIIEGVSDVPDEGPPQIPKKFMECGCQVGENDLEAPVIETVPVVSGVHLTESGEHVTILEGVKDVTIERLLKEDECICKEAGYVALNVISGIKEAGSDAAIPIIDGVLETDELKKKCSPTCVAVGATSRAILLETRKVEELYKVPLTRIISGVKITESGHQIYIIEGTLEEKPKRKHKYKATILPCTCPKRRREIPKGMTKIISGIKETESGDTVAIVEGLKVLPRTPPTIASPYGVFKVPKPRKAKKTIEKAATASKIFDPCAECKLKMKKIALEHTEVSKEKKAMPKIKRRKDNLVNIIGGISYTDSGHVVPIIEGVTEPKPCVCEICDSCENRRIENLIKVISGMMVTESGEIVPIVEGVKRASEVLKTEKDKKTVNVLFKRKEAKSVAGKPKRKIKRKTPPPVDKSVKIISGMARTLSGGVIPVVDGLKEVESCPCLTFCRPCQDKTVEKYAKVTEILKYVKISNSGNKLLSINDPRMSPTYSTRSTPPSTGSRQDPGKNYTYNVDLDKRDDSQTVQGSQQPTKKDKPLQRTKSYCHCLSERCIEDLTEVNFNNVRMVGGIKATTSGEKVFIHEGIIKTDICTCKEIPKIKLPPVEPEEPVYSKCICDDVCNCERDMRRNVPSKQTVSVIGGVRNTASGSKVSIVDGLCEATCGCMAKHHNLIHELKEFNKRRKMRLNLKGNKYVLGGVKETPLGQVYVIDGVPDKCCEKSLALNKSLKPLIPKLKFSKEIKMY